MAEKLKFSAYIIFIILGGAILLYGFFRYIFILILPFLIGFGIALTTRPMAHTVSRKTHIKESILRLIFTVFLTGAVLTLLFFGIYKISLELWKFLENLGEQNAFSDLINNTFLNFGIFTKLTSKLGKQITDALYKVFISFMTSFGNALALWLKALPKAFLFLLVTIISSVYFALDLDRITAFLKTHLPKRVTALLQKIKAGTTIFLTHYVKSYLILMTVTFSIMLLGLLILHAPNAFLFSLIIALLDLLPVIGVGTILIPLSVYEFAKQNIYMGIGLIILFLVNETVREFLEPKLLGSRFGVHPIITLFLLYVGYSLFGFFGLLLVPVGTLIFTVVFQKEKTAEVNQRTVAE